MSRQPSLMPQAPQCPAHRSRLLGPQGYDPTQVTEARVDESGHFFFIFSFPCNFFSWKYNSFTLFLVLVEETYLVIYGVLIKLVLNLSEPLKSYIRYCKSIYEVKKKYAEDSILSRLNTVTLPCLQSVRVWSVSWSVLLLRELGGCTDNAPHWMRWLFPVLATTYCCPLMSFYS